MKRMLSLLFVLAMMLPALGVAEAGLMIGDAFENGKRIELDACVVIDESLVGAQAAGMIDGFSLLVTAQKEPAQLGMTLLYGEDIVADIELETRDDDVCVRSSLLGDKAIMIKEESVEALAGRVAKYAVEQGMMTREDADGMLASLGDALKPAEGPEAPAAETEIAMTEEQQQELIDALTSIDASAVMDEIVALASKVEIVTENVVQPGSDEAAMLIHGSYTGEDVALLARAILNALRSSEGLAAMLAQGGLDLNSPSFESAVDAVLEQAAGLLKSLDFGVYLDADGSVVHVSLMPVFMAEGSEITGSVSYRRNTLEDSMLYTLDVGAGIQPPQGEYAVLFNAELTRQVRADGSRIVFAMDDLELSATTFATTQPLEGGEYSEWVLNGEMNVSGECVGTAKLQVGSFVSGPQEELPSSITSISVCLNDDEPCAMLLVQAQALAENAPAFAEDSVVDPMALTDEAFSELMDGLLSHVQAWAAEMEAMFPTL